MEETAASQATATVLTVDRYGGPYPDDLYRVPALEQDAYVADLPAVGTEQVQRYHEDGFLAVRRAFPESSVVALRSALASVTGASSGANIQYEGGSEGRLATWSEPERRAAIRKVYRFIPVSDTLRTAAQDGMIPSVVERLMGDRPVIIQDQAFLKPPSGREKPWHQDDASFRLHPDTPIVSVWIAVDPATTENGCMCLVRGSHRHGPVRHHKIRDFQIRDEEVETARAVAVPLDPGGLLFFDGLVHHGTAQNRSSDSRWSISFHYAPATAAHLSDEDYRSFFGS